MDWRAGRTWYEVHGGEKADQALVVLHGGPGYPHFYLGGLSGLASDKRKVILYDQVGCGNSKARPGMHDWSVSLFVEELEELRGQLGLRGMHLLGHSWGCSLAVEYALKSPDRVSRLVLSSPLFDSKLWVEEARRLQDGLPDGLGEVMQTHEADGTTDSEEYQAASQEFLLRHDCSISPNPPEMQSSNDQFGVEVYNQMWGPSETFSTGVLKDWSCLDRLPDLQCPVLITSGEMDTATPRQVAAGAEQIKDMRWQLFPQGTHSLHLEFPDRYRAAVEAFLAPLSD